MSFESSAFSLSVSALTLSSSTSLALAFSIFRSLNVLCNSHYCGQNFRKICLCLLRNVISYQALYSVRENVEGNNITKVMRLVRRNLAK